MYHICHHILYLLIRSYKQLIIHIYIAMAAHQRQHLLVATTLYSPEHLIDQILLPAYSDGSLHSYTTNLKIPLRAKTLARDP